MANAVIDELLRKLGPKKVILDDDLTSRYHHIWEMNTPIEAFAVVLPYSTEDLSSVMKICHFHEQEVVIHGGLTNLVGSTSTLSHQLIVSLEKMNAILEVDKESRTITTEAGCILENVQRAAIGNDMLFPLNFGAKGSAQVGGILSTNAGGLRVLKYGMARNMVLGIEVVLADGTIISSLKKIIKDNSAYDLKHLFIGSEGTLGIITKAVFKLVEAPVTRNSAMVVTNDYARVISLLKLMDRGLSGKLSGFELMWDTYYTNATSAPSETKPLLPHGSKYYVLIESLGSSPVEDHKKLEQLLEEAMEKDIINDGVIANGQSDLDWFWRIREDVHAVVSRCTFDQHFDISIPIPLIGTTVNAIIKRLEALDGVEIVFPFGHIADGNIHLIVGKENTSDSLKEQINQIVYSPLKAIGGSVSAEHGIGMDKKKYLNLCRSEAEIELMKSLKISLDPKNILNPGRVLDI